MGAPGVAMAIRPDATRVLVLTYNPVERFASLSWDLAAWLRMFPAENVIPVWRRDAEAARNWAFDELCVKAPAAIRDFIMVDRDMRPGPKTLPFLEVEADLVGCTFDAGDGVCSFVRPDDVHAGLFRFNRRAVESLAASPPWWKAEHGPRGTQFTCECVSFRNKVKQAGLTVARAGWCGHGDR